MEYNEIKHLLDQYFKGETSLSEEKILKDYFVKHPQIPAEFEYARQLFTHFHNESAIKSDKVDEVRIPKINRRRLIRFAGIAAGILIIIGIWLMIKKTAPPPTVYAYINGVPVTDRGVALYEANKVFTLLSDHLRTGTKDLNQLSKYNKYERIIIKTMQP